MEKFVNEFSKKLQNKIQENDAFQKEWDITIFEENGIVTIEGSVPSKDILEKAEAFIKDQDGVKAVINKMGIDPNLEESDQEVTIEKDDHIPPVRNHPG